MPCPGRRQHRPRPQSRRLAVWRGRKPELKTVRKRKPAPARHFSTVSAGCCLLGSPTGRRECRQTQTAASHLPQTDFLLEERLKGSEKAPCSESFRSKP